MTEPFQFAETLKQYVARSAYTPGQLANLADLPRTTIVNWLNGRVRHPRDWQPIVRLLTAMHLNETEANEVLQAANQPMVAQLRLLARQAQDKKLLAAWPAPAPTPDRSYRPPFQAIADTPYFVGRETILDHLKSCLLNTDGPSICTVQGMAGTGKTTLATRLAYQLRPHFPDGTLWARLDLSDTMTILHTFAQAYGVDVSPYADVDSRSRVVRGVLADKRALIILDNAEDSAAVAPLLPPTGQCAVLITTRRHDLRVAHGVNRVDLSSFAPDAAAIEQLFAYFMGAEWARADSQHLAEIAACVGYLPLALVIVAGRLAYEPGWATVDFLARLKQTSRRLAELQSEDQSVRVSFAASFQLLTVDIQSIFATLSLFRGEDFTDSAAAAAAAVSRDLAQDSLRTLYRLSLVQLSRGGRYRLHPLLRDYAREQLRDESAGTRLAHYYIDFLQRHDPATVELADESSNILGLIEMGQARLETAVFVQLVIAFAPTLKIWGLFALAQKQLEQAVELAQADHQLPVLIHLAQIARHNRDYDRADAYLATAVAQAQEQQDIPTLSTIETEKGIIASCRSDFAGARVHFTAGLALCRQHNQPRHLIPVLKELGALEVVYGNYKLAHTYYQEALAQARAAQPMHVPALLRCLGGIAILAEQDFTRARLLYEDGLAQAERMNSRQDRISLLNNLAVVVFYQGERVLARQLLQEGLSEARHSYYQVGVGMILGNLGRLAIDEQQWEDAQRYLEEGVALVTAVAHHQMIIALQQSQATLAGRQQKYQAAEQYLQHALRQAQSIEYRSGVIRVLQQWAALYLQQQSARLPSQFLVTYSQLAAIYDLEQTPDEFAAACEKTVVDRLKIFYD